MTFGALTRSSLNTKDLTAIGLNQGASEQAGCPQVNIEQT